MDQAARALPAAVPDGLKVSLHCWKERQGGKRFHNRFVLTDVGGVQFGDSVERGHAAQDDRISILEETSRATLWEDFVGATPSYDAVGTSREFEGRRRR
jgi:hypothetical protein